MATKKNPIDFEAALEKLTTIVKTLESGGLSIEKALGHFEEGIQLTKLCQQQLQQYDQRVKVLLNQNGESQLVDFDLKDDSDGE